MMKYKTTAQVLVINTIFMIFMYVFWVNNWLATAIAADPTMIVIAISIITVIGMGMSLYNAIKIDGELNDITSFSTYSDETLKAVLSTRLSSLVLMSNTVVNLGLMGTLIGFIIGLSGVTPDTLVSFQGVSTGVAQLIMGLSTAFYTTLAGSIANIVLEINVMYINKGMTNLYIEVMG